MNRKQDARRMYREERSITDDRGHYVGYVLNEQGPLCDGGPYFVRGPNLTYAEETQRFETVDAAAEWLRATGKARGL